MKTIEKKSAPDPSRPLMIQRLRIGHENPAVWNKLFEELKKYRDCCDEIWFSTGVGIPDITKHRHMSSLMAEHAKNLRSIGIIPGLQIQATIGHGDEITEADSTEGKTWDSYVGLHGEKCRFINCPRQPGFLDYMRQMAEIYAQWHPSSVWIDDDLRPDNHSPAFADGGCCCPLCLSIFSREQNRAYTREDIEEAYENDSELKKLWHGFSLRSMGQIAEIIASAFRQISPQTRIALQHNAGSHRKAVFDYIYRASGKCTASRPGGGAYSDHIPYAIIDKGILLSRQKYSQQGYDMLDQICAEIESCPRIFTCKTSQGHRLESLFYLAMGMDSLSYFIMDPDCETPEWYGRNLLAPLAEEAACYREYIRHNEGTQPGGAGLAVPDECRSDISVLKYGLPLTGIPFAGYSPFAACHFITEDQAAAWPEDKLTEALRGSVLLDGAAAKIIHDRGMGKMLGGVISRPLNKSVCSYYTDDPFNDGLPTVKNTTLSNVRFVFDIPENSSCRVLSHYRDSKQEDCGAETLLLERPDGTRIAFIGFDGFNTCFISSTRVMFLNKLADWTAHSKLPAVTMEATQCVIVPRIDDCGNLKSVTVLNTVIGTQKPFSIILRNIPEHAVAAWMVPAAEPVNIELKSSGNETVAMLPSLGPWDIGWLKITDC